MNEIPPKHYTPRFRKVQPHQLSEHHRDTDTRKDTDRRENRNTLQKQPTSDAAYQHPWNQLLRCDDHPHRDRRNTTIPPSKEALQLRRTRPTNHPIRRSCLPWTNPERMQPESQMDPGPMHPHTYPTLPKQLDNQNVLPG